MIRIGFIISGILLFVVIIDQQRFERRVRQIIAGNNGFLNCGTISLHAERKQTHVALPTIALLPPAAPHGITATVEGSATSSARAPEGWLLRLSAEKCFLALNVIFLAAYTGRT
jgi:hypothetical protein